MANQVKLFTNKEDFRKIGMQDFAINPFLYHNGKDWVVSNSKIRNFFYGNGTPTVVDGKRGKAMQMNGSHACFGQVGMTAATRYSLSFWVKPTANDISINKSWCILATNRGHASNLGSAYSNQGFHVAIHNADSGGVGTLNVRMYGATSINMYSNEGVFGRGDFSFVADQWTHVCVIYDQSKPYKAEVYVNGELILFTSADPNLSAGWNNSFTIGDMLTSGGASQYPFEGAFDDVIFAYGADAWTSEQAVDYYNRIQSGQFLDYETTDGSLQLGKDSAGKYTTTPLSWESEVVDLGADGFVDYGLLQAVGTVPSGTSMTFYTRTSADGSTWGSWQKVNAEGEIQSNNFRYLQVRVVFSSSNGTYTPILEAVEILEDQFPELPNMKVYRNSKLELFHDLETGLSSLGEVKNAYDIMIEEEINGEDILTFKLPVKDKKRQEVGSEPVEMVAKIEDRFYIVKEILDKRDDDGKLYSEFKCEARWTELRDWYVDGIEVVRVDAHKAIETIFSNIFGEIGDPVFDWKIGIVEITKKRTLRSEWKDVLGLLHDVQSTWGGELLFDTKTKTVHLLNKIGKDSGIRFQYTKNLKNVERQIETYDLVTRIYPEGKGGLDITTVNGGVPYLENRTWVDQLNLRRKVIPYKWKDERYTIPLNLMEDAQKMLDEMSKPTVRYAFKVHDLSALTGHEHESFDLGDTVTAIDSELFNEEIVNRIVRRKIDVRKPENTDVELAQPQKTLADIQARALDDSVRNLVESDPLSTTDVQQMTVFNHLLNSRADEGINGDWTPIGTDFTIENVGFSGNWSFKVQPDYGRENSLTQTVEGVSHRSVYTISAAVAKEGDITRGSAEDAFVGIKIVVHYQDGGEPDVHYLAVPDITNNTVE